MPALPSSTPSAARPADQSSPRAAAARLVARLGPLAPVLAILAAGVFPFGAYLLIASRHGLGVTPDSVGYVSAARTLAASGQLHYFDGQAFVRWPPGYPALLGVAAAIGLDLQAAALWLNVAAGIATIGLTYLIVRPLTGSRLAGVIAAGAIGISTATLDIHQMLWSEGLFTALSLAALWRMEAVLSHGARVRDVAAIAVAISLACTVRYIGVAYIPAAALAVLIGAWPTGRRRAIVTAGAVCVASLVGLALEVVRNLSLGTGPFGPRDPSRYSLPRALSDTVHTLGLVVAPFARPGRLTEVGACVIVAVLIGIGVALWQGGQVRRWALVLAAALAAYYVVLVYSELSTNLNTIDRRYLFPAIPLVVAFCVAAGRSVWGGLAERADPLLRIARQAPLLATPSGRAVVGWGARGVTAVALVVFTWLNLTGSLRYARTASHGVGYNAPSMLDSALAAAVRALPPGVVVLSNEPVELYWAAGRYPSPTSRSLAPIKSTLADLRASVQGGQTVFYAAYSATDTAQGISETTLTAAGLTLQPVATYPDGQLKRVTVAGQ